MLTESIGITSRAQHTPKIKPRRVVALLIGWLTLMTPAPWAAQLDEIGTEPAADSCRIILSLNQPVRFAAHTLEATAERPRRCYVDLEDTQPAPHLQRQISMDSKLIDGIRTGRRGQQLRVVLDMARNSLCRVSTSSADNRIILTLTPTAVTHEPGTKTSDQGPMAVTSNSAPPSTEPPSGVKATKERPAASAAPENQLASPGRLSYWGRLKGFSAVDSHHEDGEDHHFNRLQARFGIGYDQDLRDDLSLAAKLSGDLDHLDYDNRNEDPAAELHQAWLARLAPGWDLTLGKQRVRWGKSDQLSPLDSINPDDLRQSLVIDQEERKLTSWLVRSRLHQPNYSLEMIFQPWFEAAELDYFDSDWALYRNLRQAIMAHSALPDNLKDYTAGLRVHEDTPDHSLANSSAALRLLWRTQQSDFAVSYRYGWETTPFIRAFPVKNLNYNGDPQADLTRVLSGNPADLTMGAVEAEFRRQKILGFEWETVFDLIGFRGELAYIDRVSLLSSDLTSVGKKVLHLVTGIDYTTAGEWYFNLQTSWYHIVSYTDRILYFDRNNTALLGEIRKPLWRGKLELSTRFQYALNDQSRYLQPALTLKYFQATEFELGAMIFAGAGDSLLGSYDQADQLYLRAEYSF